MRGEGGSIYLSHLLIDWFFTITITIGRRPLPTCPSPLPLLPLLAGEAGKGGNRLRSQISPQGHSRSQQESFPRGQGEFGIIASPSLSIASPYPSWEGDVHPLQLPAVGREVVAPPLQECGRVFTRGDRGDRGGVPTWSAVVHLHIAIT